MWRVRYAPARRVMRGPALWAGGGTQFAHPALAEGTNDMAADVPEQRFWMDKEMSGTTMRQKEEKPCLPLQRGLGGVIL